MTREEFIAFTHRPAESRPVVTDETNRYQGTWMDATEFQLKVGDIVRPKLTDFTGSAKRFKDGVRVAGTKPGDADDPYRVILEGEAWNTWWRPWDLEILL